jgi:hypothetical protein
MQKNIFRILAILTLMAVFLANPWGQVALAYGSTIEILAVRQGESVTVRARNFPESRMFVVRINRFGTQGIDGEIVATVNSGASGSFDGIYIIPTSLANEERLTIRMDSASGYHTFTTFVNQSQPAAATPTVPPPPPGEAPGDPNAQKPRLVILAVAENQWVKVRAERLPPNLHYTIRVGTFSNFFKDYQVMGAVNSGAGGDIEFIVNLPEVVFGVEMVTIRIDGDQKSFAYNAFKNAAYNAQPIYQVPSSGSSSRCEIVRTFPAQVAPGQSFDAVWDVKNRSGKTWEYGVVDYKYLNGAAFHEKPVYDIQQSVRSGETSRFVVDMRAPYERGYFTAYWAIVEGGTTLCNLRINLVVN